MNKLLLSLGLVILLAFSACNNNTDQNKEIQDSLAANATADSLLKSATDTIATDTAAADHTATDSVKH